MKAGVGLTLIYRDMLLGKKKSILPQKTQDVYNTEVATSSLLGITGWGGKLVFRGERTFKKGNPTGIVRNAQIAAAMEQKKRKIRWKFLYLLEEQGDNGKKYLGSNDSG